jgi:hypothetical protein
VERGLAVDANRPRLLATEGLSCCSMPAPPRTALRARSATRSKEALRRAIELNSRLHGEASSLLEETERLHASLPAITPS